MKRAARTFTAVAASLAVLAGTAGCAPGGKAVRRDGPGISVRLPPAEAMELGLHAQGRTPPPAPPLSVAEEYRDRWLTLFEVTFQPIEATGLPEAEEEFP